MRLAHALDHPHPVQLKIRRHRMDERVREPITRAVGPSTRVVLSCEHDTRRVTRRELDGGLTVLANSFQGRRLNRPNDVVVKSDGAIYFTDPWTLQTPQE